MLKKFLSLPQRRKWLLGVIVVVLLFIIGEWVPSWPRSTNFNGKGLWDLLDLLLVPLVLAGAAFWLDRSEKERERQLAEDARQEERRTAELVRDEERRIALDLRQETLLQSYLDRMTELLLSKDLEALDSRTRAIARIRTIEVLDRIDPQRRASILIFLAEAKLVFGKSPIIELNGATFEGIHLFLKNLSGINLSGANIRNAQLLKVSFTNAILTDADFFKSDLTGVDFTGADVRGTKFIGGSLDLTKFPNAEFTATTFIGTDVNGADFTSADFTNAWVASTDFSKAILTNATLPDNFPETIPTAEEVAARRK